MSPIFEALKAGERFGLSLLALHFEECQEYWDWWWSEARMDRLTLPSMLADDDPILEATAGNLWVDSLTYFDFFDQFLRTALQNRLVPSGDHVVRSEYQDALIRLLAARGLEQEDRVIVFVGGGYGAGKTTVLSMTGREPFLPLPAKTVAGVDAVKLYLPEFEIIRRIGDGRASSVVQSEARNLSERLFERLVRTGRSFMWDSSMSDLEASLVRIRTAKAQGYRLILVGVGSPIEAAVAKAMGRAKLTRRFAHPDHLVDSHRKFARAFPAYFDEFDEVMLFWNRWSPHSEMVDPLLIAEKDRSDNRLVSYGDGALKEFFSQASEV